MSDSTKQPISERKRLANQLNAQRSTGPKTVEGKLKSRANAIKHGLCARVIEVEGEDPTVFEERFETWDAELNPANSNAVRYLVAQAVRKTVRLDRCHVVHDATVADLARDAGRARADERMTRVEGLVRLLKDDPDVACRRLRETSEGCGQLIDEWARLGPTLVEPMHWDAFDEHVALALFGALRAYRGQTPSPLGLPTLAIKKHRDVCERLALNASGRAMPGERYWGETDHQHDRDRVHDLYLSAITAKAEIEAVIAREVAALRARKAELEAAEAVEASEAGLRARFDATDRGKLFHRYEVETERGLHRDIKEIRTLGTWTMQMAELIGLEAKRLGKQPPVDLRNEATVGVAGRAVVSPRVVQGEGFATVEMSIVPGWDGKRRQ